MGTAPLTPQKNEFACFVFHLKKYQHLKKKKCLL